MGRESIQRRATPKRSVGCGACGAVIETDAPVDSPCPRCGRPSLYDLDGGPAVGAHAVMQAWLLHDAHTRVESLGLVSGAALGFVVGLAGALAFGASASLLWAGYLAVAGACAGAALVVPALRRLAPHRPWVERAGARKAWLVALGVWAVVLPAVLGSLYALGGGGRPGLALRRGVELLWSKVVGG